MEREGESRDSHQNVNKINDFGHSATQLLSVLHFPELPIKYKCDVVRC